MDIIGEVIALDAEAKERLKAEEQEQERVEDLLRRNALATKLVEIADEKVGKNTHGAYVTMNVTPKVGAKLIETLGLPEGFDASRLSFRIGKAKDLGQGDPHRKAELSLVYMMPHKGSDVELPEEIITFGAEECYEHHSLPEGQTGLWISNGKRDKYVLMDSPEYTFVKTVSETFLNEGFEVTQAEE